MGGFGGVGCRTKTAKSQDRKVDKVGRSGKKITDLAVPYPPLPAANQVDADAGTDVEMSDNEDMAMDDASEDEKMLWRMELLHIRIFA